MSRRSLAAVVVIGVTLAASVAAHPGIFEYWKAGARTSRSKSSAPQGHSHTRQANAPPQTSSVPAVMPWTKTWFADSSMVRSRIAAMTEAVTNPMIGETYPLPRGGGFVCSRTEGDGKASEGGFTCALQCTGPELGARRRNWFYVSASSAAPTLDRVRWVVVAPDPTLHASWRAFLLALADSISVVMGRPAWSGPDSINAAWDWKGRKTTMRLYCGPTRVDSLEIGCVSERLARGEGREEMP